MVANAATRSVIEGSDFGDNVLAALPDTIAQTIGNLLIDKIFAEKNQDNGDLPLKSGSVSTNDGTITARSGDNLKSLALKYGISESRLAALNGLNVGDSLTAGQQLFIAPDFQIGLDRDFRAAAYAKDAKDLFNAWPKLTPDQRELQFIEIINKQLVDSGVPALTGFNVVPTGSAAATHDDTNHAININSLSVFSSKISLSDFKEFANTLYHEARHGEQDFRILQIFAGSGSPKSSAGFVLGVAPFQGLVDAAYARPVNPASHGSEYFDAIQQSEYGANDAERQAVIPPLIAGKSNFIQSDPAAGGLTNYQRYRDLPEEQDAWRTAGKVLDYWP